MNHISDEQTHYLLSHIHDDATLILTNEQYQRNRSMIHDYIPVRCGSLSVLQACIATNFTERAAAAKLAAENASDGVDFMVFSDNILTTLLYHTSTWVENGLTQDANAKLHFNMQPVFFGSYEQAAVKQAEIAVFLESLQYSQIGKREYQ